MSNELIFPTRPIKAQIEELSEGFDIEPTQALEYVKRLAECWNLSSDIEEGTPLEGNFLLAILSTNRLVAKKRILSSKNRYKYACDIILEKIGADRVDETKSLLRQQPRTIEAMERIESEQPGGILIIAPNSQLHETYRSSVGELYGGFTYGSGYGFSLGVAAVASMIFTHREYCTNGEALPIRCGGDYITHHEGTKGGHKNTSNFSLFKFLVTGMKEAYKNIPTFFPVKGATVVLGSVHDDSPTTKEMLLFHSSCRNELSPPQPKLNVFVEGTSQR